MSSYIYFFYRKDGAPAADTLFSVSRSHNLHELFEDIIPYGKILPLEEWHLAAAREECQKHIANLQECIDHDNALLDIYKDHPYSEELEERILDLLSDRKGTEDYLKEKASTLAQLDMLEWVLQERLYKCDHTTPALYVGIEPEEWELEGVKFEW